MRVVTREDYEKCAIALLEERGRKLKTGDGDLDDIVERLQGLDDQGYCILDAPATLELIVYGMEGFRHKFFEIIEYKLDNHKYRMDRDSLVQAIIKVNIAGAGKVHTASSGNGPVDATNNVIKKALSRIFKSLEEVELVDYNVAMASNCNIGSDAKVRVAIEFKDKECSWVTASVSHNINDANLEALSDGFDYKLTRDQYFK
ncbi:alpha-isopropylmalate synthase regulatory domain-containing protein [Patescibacteria group bacterium]